MNERIQEEFRLLVQRQDPAFYRLIEKHPKLSLPVPRPRLEALVRIVVGQQLSVKAAETIFKRLTASLDAEFTADQLSRTPLESLRASGLSASKSHTVLLLGRQEPNWQLPWNELRKQLLEVKGIGPWTVDMFAIFGLGEHDVFSASDLGLRVAMEKYLDIPPKQKPDVYAHRALLWRPYRSLASLHLWHALDNQPK